MRVRLAAVCVMVVVLLFSVVAPAHALYWPTYKYNQIAWTWKYSAPYSRTYNCLAYALGYSDRWVWPWSGRPTVAQLDVYMRSRGYMRVSSKSHPAIVAYGPGNGPKGTIAHFSRIVGTGTTRAKWGSLELMTSYSWSPYYNTTASYGLPMAYYKRRR